MLDDVCMLYTTLLIDIPVVICHSHLLTLSFSLSLSLSLSLFPLTEFLGGN